MTMRQIASGDDGNDEGRDQHHGHDERGVINAQDPIHPTRRRRNRERQRKERANRWMEDRAKVNESGSHSVGDGLMQRRSVIITATSMTSDGQAGAKQA